MYTFTKKQEANIKCIYGYERIEIPILAKPLKDAMPLEEYEEMIKAQQQKEEETKEEIKAEESIEKKEEEIKPEKETFPDINPYLKKQLDGLMKVLSATIDEKLQPIYEKIKKI